MPYDDLNNWTLTTNSVHSGWRTDSGCGDYGLPKAIAQWICDILNKSDEEPPMELKNYCGDWE